MEIIIKKWLSKYDYLPDAIVVEGPKAGGHLGFKPEQLEDDKFSLEQILTEVLELVMPYAEKFGRKIPVIAAGGVYTGGDIKKMMQMGAAGVQMGTRFVTTVECDASDAFKQTYINASEEDIVIIKSPVGMPGRAIKNNYLQQVEAGNKKPFKCPYHCIVTCDHETSPYCISLSLKNAQKGDLNNGFAFGGTNAYRSDKIISVEELVEQLQEEYMEAQ